MRNAKLRYHKSIKVDRIIDVFDKNICTVIHY